ncbi:27 kDa antigen Cfp30B [mine drainage metagenome]|uniref:27 kDa antigen Cfp30B n=1 Tax=mine drainage metagenome TaxID=410659 RepID=A0A1J5QQT7_9ZZZZ
MSVRHEAWPAGTPAWSDLTVPDRVTAHNFYRTLFGWSIADGPAEMGYYANATLHGETVAGIEQAMDGQAGMPPAWMTYLATDDAEATAAAVTAAGGTVLVPAMAVMDLGSMGRFADPTGAVFGVWQSGTHTGANIVNEPGSVVWNEVMTTDFEAAKAFYATVFGYTYTDMSGNGFVYATVEVDGVTRGGIGAIGPEMGPLPPHWLTYFATGDTDASVTLVTEHGGSLVRDAWDSPYGRMAVVTGPAGETFALMGTTPDPAESAVSGS